MENKQASAQRNKERGAGKEVEGRKVKET